MGWIGQYRIQILSKTENYKDIFIYFYGIVMYILVYVSKLLSKQVKKSRLSKYDKNMDQLFKFEFYCNPKILI